MVYLIVAVVKICSMIDFFALRFGGKGLGWLCGTFLKQRNDCLASYLLLHRFGCE